MRYQRWKNHDSAIATPLRNDCAAYAAVHATAHAAVHATAHAAAHAAAHVAAHAA